MSISQRSELLFLYDVKRCNPNGDPMDANRPRIDEETGKCLVTDVRLKRTIRDYLFENGFHGQTKESNYKGDIFVRDEDGKPVTGQKRSESYKDAQEYCSKFIDVRLFGGVSAPKKKDKLKKDDNTEGNEDEKKDPKKTFHFTGPVQFGMGTTLHEVHENFIKGTGAFATKEGAEQRTFREEYNITYGLVGFHGVINENAAKHTGLSNEDVALLIDAMWNGTKNLLTRSKKGHSPRLLVKIDYNVPNFFIGELVERVSIALNNKRIEQLDDVSDFTLQTDALNALLTKYADKIAKITVWQDDRLVLSSPIITK